MRGFADHFERKMAALLAYVCGYISLTVWNLDPPPTQAIDVPVFEMGTSASPVEIARRGVEEAKRLGVDAVIVDTAGRLQVCSCFNLARFHSLEFLAACSSRVHASESPPPD